MILPSLPRGLAMVVAGLVLSAGGAGCALRATTDFGPQSSASKRSLSVGPERLPGGVSAESSPDGDTVGLRGNGAPSAAGGATGPQ